MRRLVCVSNRVAIPRAHSAPGGLTVGVLAALREHGGLWFGWSGEVTERRAVEANLHVHRGISYATIDLPRREFDRYYNGFCNGVLWPLFHYLASGLPYTTESRNAYFDVNQRFASALARLLRSDDLVWVHDYHLIPIARMLRQAGFGGRTGFFLHIPFPNIEMLRTLPNHAELIADLCQYDLVGLQTAGDLAALRGAVESCLPSVTQVGTNRLRVGTRDLGVGVFPIGVDCDVIAEAAGKAATGERVRRMTASLVGRKLILGVDRLDYSKGLLERFNAYERLLTNCPEYHGKVTFMQIAPLSRGDVRAYGEIRRSLEQAAGRVNGRLGDADWTPIRYLNRNFEHDELMGFLRAAQVGLVTPVRDGMNLVAKEFVAAQEPMDPGVLVLSPLAGAARELTAALHVNPYDADAVARTIAQALEMPLVERRARHQAMLEHLRVHDIHHWHRSFLEALSGQPVPRGHDTSMAALRHAGADS